MEKYVSLDGLKTIAKTINEISVSMEEFKAALEEIAKIGCRMDAMEEALALARLEAGLPQLTK